MKVLKSYVNDTGYICEKCEHNGRVFWIGQHKRIYEQHYGRVRKGYNIHHINKNKTDNRIENLIALRTDSHKNLHHDEHLALH